MEPQEEHNEAEKGKRNMEKLFDLQVFAQENTQTCLLYTSPSPRD